MKVNVFLLQDVPKIGSKGEIISVKIGYANNYLVAQKLGITVNAQNEKELLANKKILEKKKEVVISKTSLIADRIKDLVLKIEKVAHEGKLYGSVNASEIVELLDKEGVKVNKSQIEMPAKSIKTEGTYDIVIKLTTQLKPHFKLKVIHS